MAEARERVVVVGAGIVGVSVAYHLARRGAEVTVLDGGQPGEGASRASFAWINARDKNPRAYHDLNRRGLDAWPRFASALGCEKACVWGGEMRWANSRDGAAAIRGRVATLQAWGYDVRELSGDMVAALEPGATTSGAACGSYTLVDGHVDTGLVVAACLDAVRRSGNDVVTDAEVTGFELHDRSVSEVVSTKGSFECDAVVLACGAETRSVAELAGVDVPMYDTFGATLVTTPVAPLFETAAVVHTPREAEVPLNVRQLADGRVMIHGGSHGQSHDESLGRTDEDVARVFRTAMQYFPALEEARIEEVRRGRRPIPEDGQSIIGFADGVGNLYVVVTHSGVTLAPLLGELATLEIVDGATVDFLAPFRATRFADPIENA